MNLTILQEDRTNIKNILKRFKQPKSTEEIFYNLCFAICAPQTTFSANIKCNQKLRELDFYNKHIPTDKLEEITKLVRFKHNKATYLNNIKWNFHATDYNIVRMCKAEKAMRESFVGRIKGLGYKAASHFLRNLGYEDLAIIDTHILKFMGIDKFNFSKKDYLKIEDNFRTIAKENNLSVAGLDAYVWKTYSGTKWEDFVF